MTVFYLAKNKTGVLELCSSSRLFLTKVGLDNMDGRLIMASLL